MKTLKTTVLTLALLAGLSSAFATKAAHNVKTQAPVYDWNGSGPNGSGSLFGKTVAQAMTYYGCSGTGSFCALGVDPNGILNNQTIKKP